MERLQPCGMPRRSAELPAERFGNDAMLVSMLELGRRTVMFGALAQGPGTSDEIADRAGLNERYVREWLGALVTARIATYDPAAATYSLPPAAALCLSGREPIPAPAPRSGVFVGTRPMG